MILIVGEIIPAAILTGPNQLQIAGFLVPLVWFILIIFFPVSYPMSLVLDYLLGHDEGVTLYNKKELATLVRLQHEEGNKEEGREEGHSMHLDDVAIIGGALKFRDMMVSEIMTKLEDCFMLSTTGIREFIYII